jgi:hypothetical protein
MSYVEFSEVVFCSDFDGAEGKINENVIGFCNQDSLFFTTLSNNGKVKVLCSILKIMDGWMS